MSRYVHLNPVGVKSLGLDKKESKALRARKLSDLELIQERLVKLKEYPWSSYRAYVGSEKNRVVNDGICVKEGGRKRSVPETGREGSMGRNEREPVGVVEVGDGFRWEKVAGDD